MGTRGTIALEYADGTVEQIYCHWDNYLSGTGQILQNNYMDPFKVQQLLDLGNLSTLGEEIGVKRPFDAPGRYGSDEYLAFQSKWAGQCLFYGRDRGEYSQQSNKYAHIQEYFSECQQEEYDYLLRCVNGVATWFVRCSATDDVWVTLAVAPAAQAAVA
jgi:hypothetical protein